MQWQIAPDWGRLLPLPRDRVRRFRRNAYVPCVSNNTYFSRDMADYPSRLAGWPALFEERKLTMTNTPKSLTREPLTTTTKEDEIELMEQELSRVTGGDGKNLPPPTNPPYAGSGLGGGPVDHGGVDRGDFGPAAQ
jgi:hypothetical protein